MARTLSYNEIKQRAGRFCAFRERSPQEVLEKSMSWGLQEEKAKKLVSQLTKDGYIDEQRFVNAYCHDKFEFNSWGKQKIRASLIPHRLADVIVDRGLARIDFDSYERRLLDLAEKKWEHLSKDPPVKRKQKTINYLANKGFELDLIWKTLSLLEKQSL